jgi:hypothetical protein
MRPLVILAFLSVPLAAAAETPADKAASVELFNEGKKLMAAGKYAEACPKFEASLALVPGIGTRLNLGDCLEKLGKTASAWAVFRDAGLAADKAGDAPKRKFADERMAKLETRLARLTVRLAAGADLPGLEVQRDGEAVGKVLLGNALPVDPGEHVVTARAPDHRPWSQKVTVADGATATVDVPKLEAVAPAPTPTPTPLAPTPVQPQAPVAPVPPAAADEDPGHGRRILGLVVGGVGVAGLVTGGIFALSAKHKHDDAQNGHCDSKSVCDQTGFDLTNDARSAGTIATIAFGVGAAAVAAGVVLYLTAPSETHAVAIAPTGSGLVLAGAF